MRHDTRMTMEANADFLRLYRENWLNRMVGAASPLRSFDDAAPTHTQRIDRGKMLVCIGQIKGSVNRTTDFDTHFRPCNKHTRQRWMRIWFARQKGIPLPLVKLHKIGDHYFVEDGHHRISVARMLGQEFIEAEVIEHKPQ